MKKPLLSIKPGVYRVKIKSVKVLIFTGHSDARPMKQIKTTVTISDGKFKGRELVSIHEI